MRRRRSPDALQDFLPLRPPLLVLLVYGWLIYYLELFALLRLPITSPAGSGYASALLPTVTLLHASFALLLMVDAAAALQVARRGPARVALETALALGVLWGLQRSLELMALAGF